MKKLSIWIVFITVSSSLIWAAGTEPTGTPRQVFTLDHLLWISTNNSSWGDNFIQTADIDANPTSTWYPDGGGGYYGFWPIGNNSTKFTGIYDGQGYTIDGLTINRSAESHMGLFGYLEGGTVQNLNLTNASVTGYRYIGTIAGSIYNGSAITSCTSAGNVNGSLNTGGITGYCYGSNITYCSSSCTVSGGQYSGGLVGDASIYTTNINCCYSTGDVSGTNYVGGFIGYNYYGAYVRNSYSRGNVSRSSGTSNNIGAFCGYNNYGYSPPANIEYCYSTGSVYYIGGTDPTDKGFIGTDVWSDIFNSNFFDSDRSNQSTAIGATAKSNADMKNSTTFTALSTPGLTTPWDFVGNPNDDAASNDYWDIDPNLNDGYPFLFWQEFTVLAPEFDLLESNPYDFGSHNIGTQTDAVFTIENTGTDNLTLVTPLTISGADAGQFSIHAQPTTPIAPSGNTNFTVRFAPTTVGSKSASVSIGNNDSDENPYILTLNGEGLSINQAPIADAGTDATVIEFDTYQLDGSGSYDPDDDPITYFWTIISKPVGSSSTLSSQTIINPTITVDLVGQYVIELIVNDGETGSSPDQLVLTAISGCESIEQLIEDLSAMEIHHGVKNALIKKLNNANISCGLGDYRTACNILNAFINHCNAQTEKMLSIEQANFLINAANHIIDLLKNYKLIEGSQENNQVAIPVDFIVEQNYPNPFNPATNIRYEIATSGKVSVQIYDILGQLVKTLVNTEQSAGIYTVIWNGTNVQGELVPSGTYISRVTTNGEVKTMTMMYLK